MQLTFLGSRGSHAVTSPTHQRHSALLVESGGVRLMLDCGSDWDDAVLAIAPDAIILTHAHDDHAGGIGPEIECPVFAAAGTWGALNEVEIRNKRIFSAGQQLTFGGIRLTPFAIAHSFRAPAVSLHIESPIGRCCYAPDIAGIDSPDMLRGDLLYIGDGSAWDETLLRQEAGQSCGHAPIPLQLAWCLEAGVAEAIFTHCGEQVVRRAAEMQARLKSRAAESGVTASFAYDGMVRQFSVG